VRIDAFNPQMQLIETTEGDLETIHYTRDGNGRITAVSQGEGTDTRTLTVSYNAEGYVASITDPLFRTVEFEYDAAGRVTRQLLPVGRELIFAYDANGNVTSVTPPEQPAHEFTYTAVNHPQAYLPPDVGFQPRSTTYTYNTDRQLTDVVRPDGAGLSIAYDSAGRVSTRTTQAGHLTYADEELTGLLSSIDTPAGETLAMSYDGALLTAASWQGVINGSVEVVYNDEFKAASRTVNGLDVVNFVYDHDGLITQAGNLEIARENATGLIAGSSIGNVTEGRSYNAFGELSGLVVEYAGTPVYTVQYSRDKLGRITGKSETVEGTPHNYGYAYDPAGWLTEVQQDSAVVESYYYDTNGNRLDASGVTATFDGQDRLIQSGTTAYAYTNNGELSSRTEGSASTAFTYDVFGNLIEVVLPDTTQIEYVIDGLNRRIGKRVDGALVQGFLYRDQLNPVAELDGDGNVVSRFVYASRSNVPDFMVKGGVTYRIVSDHLGSPRLIIDVATGTVAQRLDYDAYGRVLLDSNPGFQPFGFAGGLYDDDSRLTRFGYRDYDAESGRWTAKDPLLFAGLSPNLYQYVLGDPVNFSDYGGLAMSAAAAAQLEGALYGTVGSWAEFAAGEIAGIATGIATSFGLDGPASGIGVGQLVGESIAGFLLDLDRAQQLSDHYDRLIREHQEREIRQLMDEIRELLYGCD